MGLHKILWLRGLVFTVLVPGSVGLYLPKALASGHKQAEGPASYAGWALVLSGVAVYAVCLGHFLRAGGTPAIFFARRLRLLIGEEPSRLVAGGLYAFSRNPMYVGVLLAIFGQALLYSFSNPGNLRRNRLDELPRGNHHRGRASSQSYARPGVPGDCRKVPRWLFRTP
jgi:protein-S-isoprenylcysteine O-methyltransferase Ste14